MRNYKGRGLRYLPRLKAQTDNTNRGLNNSSHPTRAESNNCFVIYLYETQGKRLYCKQGLSFEEAICVFRFWNWLRK